MLMFIIIFGASLSMFTMLQLLSGGWPISFKDPVKLLGSDTTDEDKPFNVAEALKNDPLAQKIDALSRNESEPQIEAIASRMVASSCDHRTHTQFLNEYYYSNNLTKNLNFKESDLLTKILYTTTRGFSDNEN